MVPNILHRVQELGFTIFTEGDYNLNIVAERFKSEPNKYNDILHVVYKINGFYQHHQFRCTTEPGTFWLENPMRVSGTAVLMSPQQMRGAFELGLHKGDYPCLRQRKEVKVWRDATRDAIIDYEQMAESTAWAIQIHRASAYRVSSEVNKYSAGCTVIADPDHYETFLDLCRAQQRERGWSSFTYTIIDGD
jgi:hypothetical protein